MMVVWKIIRTSIVTVALVLFPLHPGLDSSSVSAFHGSHQSLSSTTKRTMCEPSPTNRFMSPKPWIVPLNEEIKSVKRLLLIGGGHAHVQVIKYMNTKTRPEHIHVTLVDLQSKAYYSGMVPGCISELYTLDQVQIDLKALANWAGVEFVQGKVVGMTLPPHNDTSSTSQKLIHVDTDDNNGVIMRDIPFDVISIDIGSTTRDFTTLPGVSEYCIPTRPISDLIRRIEIVEAHLLEKLRQGTSTNETNVVIVGGGAAGVELSLAMRARWGRLLKMMNDQKDKSPELGNLSITLLDSNDQLMPGESPACRMTLKNIMDKYRIEVQNNAVVTEVTSTDVLVACYNDGKKENKPISYTCCIWATGAEAHELSSKLYEQCGISISERGWILVNQHLESISHPYVFAAGDCCEIVNKKNPKAGVYAVRTGPILIQNLMNAVNNKSKRIQYNPQNDFLKLLMCGDGNALGFRFGIPMYGKWVWDLKNHIDQMFMDLFMVEKLIDETNETERGENDISQYDEVERKSKKLNPEDASRLILRTDEYVDFQSAWNVLRDMTASEKYRKDVLNCISCLEFDRTEFK